MDKLDIQTEEKFDKITEIYDGWIVFGVYFGYPDCCIKTFLNGNNTLKSPNNPFRGTGFLSCDSCSALNIDDVINKIDNHRYCNVRFRSIYDKTDNTLYEDNVRGIVTTFENNEAFVNKLKEFKQENI